MTTINENLIYSHFYNEKTTGDYFKNLYHTRLNAVLEDIDQENEKLLHQYALAYGMMCDLMGAIIGYDEFFKYFLGAYENEEEAYKTISDHYQYIIEDLDRSLRCSVGEFLKPDFKINLVMRASISHVNSTHLDDLYHVVLVFKMRRWNVNYHKNWLTEIDVPITLNE